MKKSTISRLLAVILMLALAMSVAACGGSGTDAPASAPDAPAAPAAPDEPAAPAPDAPAPSTGGVELVVNVGPNPDTIDPALNSAVDGATLCIHAFEGLYSLDENGTPIPGAAESVDISDDGLTYTFHLRDGLMWSDGSPLTAQDYIYSWTRAVDAETAADYAYMFEYIEGIDTDEDHAILPGSVPNIEAPDDRTLVVHLKYRTPYFLELTAFPTYFPVKQDIVEANGDAWATRPETYIGNGPYRMIEWVADSHISYEKNPHYWNYDALGPDVIRFVLMDDPNAMLAGFRSGELLFIDDVPGEEIASLQSDPEFKIASQLGTYYISYNTQAPHLDNPRFRQALTLAIDRGYITEQITGGTFLPAGAFVSIGIGDAVPGQEFRDVGGDYYDVYDYEGNLAEAREIIAELYPDGNIPRFEYIHNPSGLHGSIAQALQQMWAEIGVETTIGEQEWSTFLNTRKNGEYEIARNGWLNDYNDPMGMLDLFITGGGNNDGHWSNAEFDALIEAAKRENDPAVRMQLMHDAEDILFEEWVIGPVMYYVTLYMESSRLNNFYRSPLGYCYFMYTTISD